MASGPVIFAMAAPIMKGPVMIVSGKRAPSYLASRLYRLRFALAQRLGMRVEVREGDTSYRFDCRSYTEFKRAATLFQKEEGTIAWLRATLRPGDTFCDIGASDPVAADRNCASGSARIGVDIVAVITCFVTLVPFSQVCANQTVSARSPKTSIRARIKIVGVAVITRLEPVGASRQIGALYAIAAGCWHAGVSARIRVHLITIIAALKA